jgi:hypothetical protein
LRIWSSRSAGAAYRYFDCECARSCIRLCQYARADRQHDLRFSDLGAAGIQHQLARVPSRSSRAGRLGHLCISGMIGPLALVGANALCTHEFGGRRVRLQTVDQAMKSVGIFLRSWSCSHLARSRSSRSQSVPPSGSSKAGSLLRPANTMPGLPPITLTTIGQFSSSAGLRCCPIALATQRIGWKGPSRYGPAKPTPRSHSPRSIIAAMISKRRRLPWTAST